MNEMRCEKLIEKIKGLADGALICSAANLFYFTGFTGGEGYAIISPEKRVLFVDSRYTVAAKKEAADFRVVEFKKDALDDIAAECNGISVLGFEDADVSVMLYNRFKSKLPTELVPLGDICIEIRSIKSIQELSKIAEAVRLADKAFEYTVNHIKSGMKEIEVALILENYMRKNGAQKTSFDTICASGERSAMPHGTASEKQIKNGEFLTMDYGCVLDGYCSDITRTVAIGKADSRQKEIYNIVLYAQCRAVDEASANMPASKLDKVARDIIKNFGYGNNFGHALGHGVGIEVHERPNISPRNDKMILPGSVITIEPGIYIEGYGGVRIEDMLFTEKNGHAVLTKATKELLEIE